MFNRKRLFKKNNILLLSFIILYFILQFILLASTHNPQLNVYTGVFAAFQYGLCLLMVHVNKKHGTRIALVLMCLSIIPTFMSIVHGAKNAVPGLFNGLFYIITILVLAKYYIKREIESKTDYITGILNRRGLYADLNERLSLGDPFSVIYIGIDNYKSFNDSFGHGYGDELLRKAAKRIKSKLGESCTVARIGSDFVVVIEDCNDIQTIADRLLETLREKAVLVINDNPVDCYIESFAGYASFPKDADSCEVLIGCADVAMTEAMTDKSHSAYMFDATMLDRINRKVYLRNLLKNSLINHKFYLVYQPQYELKSHKLRGFEASLRVYTPEGENISPAEFIPIAEKSEMIVLIDNYVLTRGMREFKDIVTKNPELTISLNVSAKYFSDPSFVENVKRELAIIDFPPECLEIEITEYCMVESMNTTQANINALREMGVKVALDDFGTGYTALDYVASLSFDLLKIDKSLIDDIEKNKTRYEFVRNVINMGKLMKCKIISEGVENDGQIECLKEAGCDFIQGFVWGKPLSYEDAKKIVDNE